MITDETSVHIILINNDEFVINILCIELLQTVNKCPINDVEKHKHEREKKAGTFVDPSGDLLRSHRGPGVLGWLVTGALAAVTLWLLASRTAYEVVEALRCDSRQIHRRWEALESKAYCSF